MTKMKLLGMVMLLLLLSACAAPQQDRQQRIVELQDQIAKQTAVIREVTSERDALIAERKQRLDKATAIVNFVNEADKLRNDLSLIWLTWVGKHEPKRPESHYRRLFDLLSKEDQGRVGQYLHETGTLTLKIEDLHAPREAKEIKRSLLLQADKLTKFFLDWFNAPLDRESLASLYQAQEEFKNLDTQVRRDLRDLLLEYQK